MRKTATCILTVFMCIFMFTGCFAGKTLELKKIVFFELYGMIMADGKIASKESELIQMIEKAFGLPKSLYTEIISVADELRKAYDRIYDVLF